MSYGFVITEMGKNLLAKLGTGEQLQITRIMVGKGELAEGQNPADFTDLVQPVAQATSTLPLVKENTLSFIVEYRNDLNGGLEEGFWLKEFGVFAQDGQNEILLYYATLGDFPQYVQAYINGVVNIKRYPVTIAVSDKIEVVISYNALAFVTEERMKEFSETDTIPYLEGVLEETENKIQQKLDEKANVVHEHGADEITSGILPVERGGTGATTAADARTNLGAAASSHTHNYAGSSSAGGAATSAVKLQTARTIDGMNFDGSANITHFGVCNTAVNTAAKTVTLSGFVLTEGARIAVFFANTNTASNLTLNVNGTGAKAISCIKGYYAPVGQWEANQIVEFVYYSSHWIMLTANARRLTTARSIRTNLGSTSASNFDGTANITPGVTGTLPIANGGTGATSASAARTALGAFSSSGGTINGNVRINGTVAEGNSNTTASGNYSHAEGRATTASGDGSHAEGANTTASGNYSHAEGFYSTANGHYSHAEGYGCIADGAYGAHANGMSTVASSYGNVLFIKSISGKTITIDSSGKYQSVSEIKAILAQFIANQEIYVIDTYYVNSSYTKYTISSVNTTNCTITVDRDLPTSNFAPWMVVNLNVRYTKGFYQTYAEGSFCVSIGNESHAEGHKTVARGSKSHAEGESTVAYGNISHAEGYRTQAIGSYSHASGLDTIAYESNDFVMGQYNKNVPTTGSLNLSNYLTIGNGSSSARSNCFRVTHANGIFANAAYKTSGADYAELFQWFDDNPENEDRVGLFVTLDGEKIRLAEAEDDYILGVVSACPSVLGDVYDDQWKGMYEIDIYGRPVLEEVEVPVETIEVPDPENPEQMITKVICEAHTEIRQKLNPDYDPTQEYIPRSERPEWDAVGMLGKLVLIDDGTCEVNGWCSVGNGGIATNSEKQTKFRVMTRLDATHIKIMIL